MGNRILIVDDNAAILTLLGAALTRAGYRTESFRNGHEAIQLLKTKNIDLMISDQMMPEIKGSEIALIMRERDEYKNTPIILISAEESDLQFGKLIKDRIINSYFPKPFEIHRLMNMINILLKQTHKLKRS